MERFIDAVVEQIDIVKALDQSEGGFADQIELAQDVWWGNPGVIADQQYPLIYVEPVVSVPESETTGTKTRTETVRLVLLADPRVLYDPTEIVEATASREVVRTMESIEAWFEKTSLRVVNGLFEGCTKLVVASTEYAQQLRGTLYSTGASILLTADVKRAKVQ
jgi:hypothetical protein